jgi:hypothetical protein
LYNLLAPIFLRESICNANAQSGSSEGSVHDDESTHIRVPHIDLMQQLRIRIICWRVKGGAFLGSYSMAPCLWLKARLTF